MSRIFCALLLAATVIPGINAEGPRSVYGPSAPGDSAFVRVINLLPGPVRISLGATRIGPVAKGEISPYWSVAPDIYLVRAGGRELEVLPKSGTYLTLACTPAAIVLFADPAHTDPARAQLFLYNLTSLPRISLKSADGKTTVIGGVDSGHSGLVVVNAVSVALAVYDGTSLVKTLGTLELARGASFSVFATGDRGAVSLQAVKAEVKVK